MANHLERNRRQLLKTNSNTIKIGEKVRKKYITVATSVQDV